MCFCFFYFEVRGEGVGGDGGVDFGGGEVSGGFFDGSEEFLAAGVVAGLEGSVEFVEFADVGGDAKFFLEGEGGDGGEVFADGVGFHEALGGGVEFIAGEEEVEGFDVFGDFADGFVGEGVE